MYAGKSSRPVRYAAFPRSPFIIFRLCALRLSCLFRRFFSIGSIHQLFVGCPFRQFPGVLQNILQQFKAFFLKNQIRFPGVLLIVAGPMVVMVERSSLGKLGSNGLCDFFRSVRLYKVHALLQGICKSLDDFRMFFHIAGSGAEGSVGT